MLKATMPSISSLASWRTLAIIFALANLKSLPLVWHLRLLYRLFSNWKTAAQVKRTIQAQSQSQGTHPLFDSVSIFSRAPLLETDYNLHKSNSTYFSDLDESRMALMTKLLMPGLKQGSKNLEKEGHRGPTSVILGSVHTSFHREIQPYERYEIRSRVLGWDRKWIVIGSWFIRPARKGGKGKGKDKEEVILASALSKYVTKKGRFTVSPERCFTTAGWLPPKPANCNSGAGQTRESSSESDTPLHDAAAAATAAPGDTNNPSSSSDPTPPEGLPAPIPAPAPAAALAETTHSIVEKLEHAAEKASQTQTQTQPPLDPLLPLTARDKAGEWDWHRIEMERIRGLRIAANWLALDNELLDESLKG